LEPSWRKTGMRWRAFRSRKDPLRRPLRGRGVAGSRIMAPAGRKTGMRWRAFWSRKDP
jgi:heme oxygenase